ncbi:YceI family protein [Microbacterium gorillae]|uniref:YceI family protein n=1 Tax=Microbacterium gorillae TaxID=1231063 RepID=UPI0005904864|nr:YceI family protein [Microbacterium gorillae]
MSYDIETVRGTWTIDKDHSVIGFSATHAMVTKVRGTFDDFAGTVTVNGADDADVNVTIQTASIDTRQEGRDQHLRSADFFDADNFPEMTFRSTGIRIKDDEEFVLTGDLTIKDVTKSVDVQVEVGGVQTDAYGNLRAGFEGGVTISRKDWGLTWNVGLEAGGFLVSDKIKITLDVSLIKDA